MGDDTFWLQRNISSGHCLKNETTQRREKGIKAWTEKRFLGEKYNIWGGKKTSEEEENTLVKWWRVELTLEKNFGAEGEGNVM